MESPPLYVRNEVASIPLVPMAIQLLRHGAKLDDQVPGQILGLDIAALLLPKPVQPIPVVAHDDPRVGAAELPFDAIRRFTASFGMPPQAS
jgi:hypothetical protein